MKPESTVMSTERMPAWAAEGFHEACVARDKAIADRDALMAALKDCRDAFSLTLCRFASNEVTQGEHAALMRATNALYKVKHG